VGSADGPQVIRRGAEPTRSAGSGTQVWDLVAKQEDGHDLLLAYTEFPPGVSVGPHVRKYDEFIFYHDGDFFSKDNIKPGMATLHPRGIHHGPHPKALANQKKKTHTDEYAVMLDGLNPIDVLPAGESVEWKEYWASWMEKKPVESR